MKKILISFGAVTAVVAPVAAAVACGGSESSNSDVDFSNLKATISVNRDKITVVATGTKINFMDLIKAIMSKATDTTKTVEFKSSADVTTGVTVTYEKDRAKFHDNITFAFSTNNEFAKCLESL